MATSLSSSFKTCTLSLSLLCSFLFFLLTTPTPDAPNYTSPAPITPHRSVITTAAKTPPCSSTGHSNGLFNYLSLHFCLFRQNPLLSLSCLSLILLLLFYILIKTAQDHSSLVTTKLIFSLDLTPSMAALTLLVLGNGAPDVFASVAAVRTGQYGSTELGSAEFCPPARLCVRRGVCGGLRGALFDQSRAVCEGRAVLSDGGAVLVLCVSQGRDLSVAGGWVCWVLLVFCWVGVLDGFGVGRRRKEEQG